MYYLKRGLLNTFKAVKKRKILFLVLILLQIFFIIMIAWVSVFPPFNFHLKILSNAQGIITPLENADYSQIAETGETDAVIQEMLSVYSSYQAMAKNILFYLLHLMLIFLVINGSLWIFSQRILNKHKFKNLKEEIINFFRQCLKFTTTTIILSLPFAILIYYILKMLLRLEIGLDSFGQITQISLYSSLVLYYLMLNGFAFINIKSWKTFLKNFLSAAILKFYKTIPVLVINLALICGSFYLVFISLEKQIFSLVIITSILFIVILILTRIFLISSLNEKNNP